MGAVVEIWFEYLIPFLLKDSHIVQCLLSRKTSDKNVYIILREREREKAS